MPHVYFSMIPPLNIMRCSILITFMLLFLIILPQSNLAKILFIKFLMKIHEIKMHYF